MTTPPWCREKVMVYYYIITSLCLTVTSILSRRITFFYIMYNPVIDIGTNYFVLWNDFHITV